jgi:SAM-dependent methyltransferase
MRPLRVVQASPDDCSLDTNHPLADKELLVQAEITRIYPPSAQRGGQLNDISEIICGNGPGMQAPLPGSPENIYGHYPFIRNNTVPEEEFYASPRLITHLDKTAAKHVEAVYSSFLDTDMRLLDLMSSFETHLPFSFLTTDIVGLGLNSREMEGNEFLNDHVIHNLNVTPILPFPDASFDGVICTSSIEYLSHPFEIIKEISRILRPGGKIGIVVSDRWFNGEEITFWSDLHPFERQGFMLNLLRSRQEFGSLNTESIRGFPRPSTDIHLGNRVESDPIFAVWATKKEK